jgi:hypothetical protein
LGARAVATVLTASTSNTDTTSAWRGTRRRRPVSGALDNTTVKANTDTVAPMRDSLTRRSALISGRSPVGSISVVTLRKIATATVTRAK